MASPISNELDAFGISPSTLHGQPQAQATGQQRSAVTVHIEDGLEVETRIDHTPDGAVVINVYRSSLAASEDRPQPVSLLLMQDQSHCRDPSVAGPVNSFPSFAVSRSLRSLEDDDQQQTMHLSVRGRLQRSGRIWNFGTAGSSEETTDSEETTSSEEYHEVDDLNSPTPPPAYSEAFLLGNELPVSATNSVFSPFMIGGPYVVNGMEVGLEQ
jgi:hypothetical protein